MAGQSAEFPVATHAAVFTRRDLARILGLLAFSRSTLGKDYDSQHDPFSLGVASGDPGSSSVVLWTRLAPQLTGGRNPENQSIRVHWELASEPRFRRIEAQGHANAVPELAHSIHVEVDGLKPGATYFYRFTAGIHRSPTGRTRTLADYDSGDRDACINFATAACQDYTQGYFNAYEHVARDNLDFVIHLGDYIYDWPSAPGARWGSRDFVRRHLVVDPKTLDDFRQLHGQYKREVSLQRAHAAHPWIAVPDNHDGIDDASTAGARKSAAFQAYFEHMPLRLVSRPAPVTHSMQRHFVSDLGDLARFIFLDTRQFRDSQSVCGAGTTTPIPGSLNPSIQASCGELRTPGRTMLGQAQLDFLLESLSASRARWNFIVSTCVMAPFDFDPPRKAHYLYGWDGYPEERARILAHIQDSAVRNPVVLSGDWHSFWFNDVTVPGTPRFQAAPVEFATSGLTSRYPGDAALMWKAKAANPHVRYLNTEDQGYMRFSITSAKLAAACVAVDCKAPEGAPAREVARFEVDGLSPDQG